MRKIGRKPELVQVVGLSRLEDTLGIIDKKLAGHSYKTKYDWISARLYVLRNLTISLAVILSTLLVGLLVWSEVSSSGVQIEQFEVPDGFDKRGFTGKIVARRVADEVTKIRNTVATTLQTNSVSTKQLGLEQALKVPIAGVSLDALFTYARTKVGKQTIIEGEVTQTLAGHATLTVRIRGQDAYSIQGSDADLDKLFAAAAEHIYQGLQPYVLAVWRRQKGDIVGALQVLEQGTPRMRDRERALALSLWGIILRQQGKGADALEKFEQAILAAPSTAEPYYEKAETLLGLRKYDDAYAAIDAYIKLTPASSLGVSRKSYIAWLADDYDLSEKEAQKALKLDSEDPRALENLILLGLRRHDIREVERLARLLARVNPAKYGENALLIIPDGLAAAYVGLRDPDKARIYATQLLQRHPLNPQGHFRMAAVLNLERRYDEAIEYGRRALQLAPQFILGSLQVATALLEMGRLSEAEEVVEAALQRSPRATVMWATKGRLRLLQGRPQEAVELYKRAAERAPAFPEYRLEWARALVSMGDVSNGERLVGEATKLAPNWAAPYALVGEIQAARADIRKASEAYQRAIELDPKWGEPFAKWGKLLEAQGDKAGAREKYRDALNREPWNDEYKKLAEAP